MSIDLNYIRTRIESILIDTLQPVKFGIGYSKGEDEYNPKELRLRAEFGIGTSINDDKKYELEQMLKQIDEAYLTTIKLSHERNDTGRYSVLNVYITDIPKTYTLLLLNK